MIRWRPHTDLPQGPVVAVVAVRLDGETFLLAETYRWDKRAGCFVGMALGLLIKHVEFWWAPEGEVMAGLPS